MNCVMSILAVALASAVLSGPALAQDATAPPGQERPHRTFLRHRLFIHETVDRENDHRHYVQARPLRWSREFRLPTRLHYQELEIETACEWNTPDPEAGLWLPPYGAPSTIPTGPGTTPIIPGETPTIPGQPTIPTDLTTTTTTTPVDPFTIDPVDTPLDPFAKPADPAGGIEVPDPADNPVDPVGDPNTPDPFDKPVDPAADPELADPAADPNLPDPFDKPVDPSADPEIADPAGDPNTPDPFDKPVDPAADPELADPAANPSSPTQDPLETERLAIDPRAPNNTSRTFPPAITVAVGFLPGSFYVNNNSSATQSFMDTILGDPNARIGTATKPTPSKSGALGGSFTESDSLDDGVPLTGPSLSLPIKSDVSEWRSLSWLPDDTRMELYGHAYFGQAEMIGVEFDMAIYGIGARTILPLLGEPSSTFTLGGTVAMGLGYMDTDVGELVGIEPAVGLQATVHLYGNVAFNVNADYYFFITDGAVYEGPALTGGLTIGF